MRHRVAIETVTWSDSWQDRTKTFDADEAQNYAPTQATVGFFVYENREVLVLAQDFIGGPRLRYRHEIGIPKSVIAERRRHFVTVDVTWDD